ncbi:cell adhesion molecule DSCAML1-like isoform X1 [Panonychus citri]|uniref:cell adhesion molecule DSCAML1-like isoform X1 n=1 Tax=Panonychus citri TaxID=50023 RepID=UPI002306FB9D|nr:cell adhesion molecule DSCAML1-like isoform X1 [Panonychus citri]XP_053206676.1 cell adhesion molecule DSCAML1-like isoform X1 [Panonychus citri]XP_053210808.1 cell adhesion molecule DSCAML1-like isoform X1 [Panonychus citri]XP_053210812.1 cell adhesion molecule DSCAML1-like isoform X1 [Panonychus citri]XP_053212491.1 cell adhesion molecule DSCAML1-like isoform X2 [Panonychus citri]XP_053212492.1 cell adhesion molecule DSCAML1-like isoform X2 [Panonychus citri]XP_053214050.1 cell adhesion 
MFIIQMKGNIEFVFEMSLCYFIVTILFFSSSYGQEAPKVTPFSSLVKPVVGGKTSFTCQSLYGSPPLQVNWYKDGKEIGDSSFVRIKSHEDPSVLIIESVKSTHSGNYTCKISNRFGHDSYSTELIVEGSPNWIEKPTDIKSNYGETIKINCLVSGYPKPKVQWRRFKDSSWFNLPSDYISEYNIKQLGDDLIISNVNRDLNGRFGCSISNGIKPDLWAEFDVSIQVPAEFKEKNVAVSAKKGNLLELTCSADGDQPVTIKWFKDSTPIDKVDPSRYSITDAPNKEGTKSIMTVSSADVKDDGLYHCFAENSFGKDERKIRVTIIEPPPAPTNFAVQQVWSRTVSVSWSRPPESKTSILSYLIRYWKVSSTGVNDRLNEVNISSSLTLYFIKDLEPGSSYESTIIAINEVGLGVPSAKISFSTGEEEPTGAPVDLVVVSRGPTTARLAWRSPPKNTWNGKLIGFYVGYRLFDDYKTPHSFRTVYVGESNSSHHEFFLTSLLKGTKYSIIVKSYNSAGTGPESQEVTVETLAGDVPSSPRLFVSTATIDSITLGYSLPSNAANKQIQNLDLHFKEGDDSSWREMDFFVDSKEIGEYTLSALNPDTVYTVYLTASNENGVSDPSPIIKTRTSRSQRDNFANFGSIFDPAGNGQFGDYRDFVSILSIIIAVAIIIIVIVFAFVYVRKAQLEAETKPNFEFALASQTGTLALNKSIPNFGTERRFHDSDNTKPLMHGTMTLDHGNQYPVSYSNLPTESRHSKLVDPSHIYDFPR